MNGILGACGLALMGAFLSFILSAMGYSGARLVSISVSLILMIFTVGLVGDALDEVAWLRDAAGLSDAAKMALKVVGIGYATGICYDTCMDIGERGIASAVLSVGRAEILVVTVPVVSDMVKLAVGML